MPDISLQKKELRARYKALRQNGDQAAQYAADRIIMQRIIELSQYKKAALLLAYVSMGGEVDTLQLIVRALAEGKSVACPRCRKEDHAMTFHRINALDELVQGAYGIYEPRPDAPPVSPGEMADSVCLVPGLSFDVSGARLGYGGGYYDRFLAQYDGVSVGLCRAESRSESELPQDEYDIRVDIVVSDAG